MEVRGSSSSKLPLLPPNYVTINHLKERWLKEQERQKQAEIDAGDPDMRENAPATAAAAEVVVVPKTRREIINSWERERRERREKVAAENRERIEKVLVREVWWSRPGSKEEGGGNGKRREKAVAAAAEEVVVVAETRSEIIVSGERGRREKAAVEEVRPRPTRTGKAEEGENWRRRGKAAAEDREEGESRKRREKAVAETEEGGNWERREKPEGINGKKKKKKKRNYRKNKGKAKADETLGEAAGKVPETQRENVDFGCEKTEEGGNRKRSEKVRKKGEKVPEAVVDPTVAMNGKVWVKKVPLDPTAGIERKFGDFSLRERNGGGGGRRENRKDETGRKFGDNPRSDSKTVKNVGGDDPMAEIGLKIGDLGKSEKKKRGEARDVKENVEGDRTVEMKRKSGDRKGGNVRFRGLGKNIGRKAMDSSLVWVRKEDKSEVCVAGNCSEGVLAKAGEREKKPGQGRP